MQANYYYAFGQSMEPALDWDLVSYRFSSNLLRHLGDDLAAVMQALFRQFPKLRHIQHCAGGCVIPNHVVSIGRPVLTREEVGNLIETHFCSDSPYVGNRVQITLPGCGYVAHIRQGVALKDGSVPADKFDPNRFDWQRDQIFIFPKSAA